MRAAVIDRFGDPDEFRIADVEMSPVAPDAMRVQIAAAGVNQVDVTIRERAQADRFRFIFPAEVRS